MCVCHMLLLLLCFAFAHTRFPQPNCLLTHFSPCPRRFATCGLIVMGCLWVLLLGMIPIICYTSWQIISHSKSWSWMSAASVPGIAPVTTAHTSLILTPEIPSHPNIYALFSSLISLVFRLRHSRRSILIACHHILLLTPADIAKRVATAPMANAHSVAKHSRSSPALYAVGAAAAAPPIQRRRQQRGQRLQQQQPYQRLCPMSGNGNETSIIESHK